MVGVVLGLGFQWWPALHQNWQQLLFVFVYFDVIDYWIDYNPSLKKFPPKREIDVILDISIVFALFLYIYSTQLAIQNLFVAFVLFKALDFIWLWSSKVEYRPTGENKDFVDTWLEIDAVEILITSGLIFLGLNHALSPLLLTTGFIFIRVALRIAASWRYKKIHFA